MNPARLPLLLLFAALALALAACETTRPQREAVLRMAAAPFSPVLQEAPAPGPEGVLSLGGDWDLRFDPDDIGLRAGWMAPDDPLPWLAAPVPGAYHDLLPDKLWYEGSVWQRRRFAIPAQWDASERLVLELDGVALRARVWLNGLFVAEIDRPFLPIRLDITDSARRDGENLLVVETDNRRSAATVPAETWDDNWFWGGVLRGVRLRSEPAGAPQSLWAETTQQPSGWRAVLHVQAPPRALPAPQPLVLQVVDADGNLYWRETVDPSYQPAPGSRLRAEAMVTGVEGWTPRTPRLYRLQALLGAEERRVAEAPLGFRELAVRERQVFLNGAPLNLRGIALVEEFTRLSTRGTGNSPAEDLRAIRSMGFNAVRVPFHPPSPEVARLCDELGLLLWVEFPSGGTADTLGRLDVFEQFSRPYLEAMVAAYRAHPSVFLWSLGSGFDPGREDAAWFVSNAATYLRDIDSTRPVTYSGPRTSGDLCREFVDIYSFSAFPGWRDGSIYALDALLARAMEQAGNRPVLLCAYGAPALRGEREGGRFATRQSSHSEAYQAKVLQVQLEQLYRERGNPALVGGMLWSFNDYPSPAAATPEHPPAARYTSLTGLVSRRREPKAAAAMVTEFFSASQEQPASAL